jgi:hypothetical protein
MGKSKTYQLDHAHFEHRLWRNELDLVAQEATFFLKILEEYEKKTSNLPNNLVMIGEFANQFHHYQRLTKRLLEELTVIEKEVSQGVLDDNVLDTEQKKDHQYLKEEMKYFESDYRETKRKFRDFIASYEFTVASN